MHKFLLRFLLAALVVHLVACGSKNEADSDEGVVAAAPNGAEIDSTLENAADPNSAPSDASEDPSIPLVSPLTTPQATPQTTPPIESPLEPPIEPPVDSSEPPIQSTPTPNTPTPTATPSPVHFNAGNVYSTSCAGCHGADGSTAVGIEGVSLLGLTRTRAEIEAAVARMPPGGSPTCAGDQECVTGLSDLLADSFMIVSQDIFSACEDVALPVATDNLARITHQQYGYLLEDFLNARPAIIDTLIDGFRGDAITATDFNTAAEELFVDSRLFEDYRDAAESIAEVTVNEHYDRLSSCANINNCLAASIDNIAFALFRRALNSVELQRYMDLFAAAAGDAFYESGTNSEKGLRVIVEAMLQSPHFVYRQEFDGELATLAGTEVERLTPLQVASRLSFMLWQSAPDQALIEAAQSGDLEVHESTVAHIERMMESPKFLRTSDSFHQQLLHAQNFAVDTKVPALPANAAASMTQELTLFSRELMLSENGRYEDLVTANFTYVDETLANIYGLPGQFSDSFERVELPADQRSGLLTQIGYLSSHASATQSSPITRGTFFLNNVLCDTVSPPTFQIEIPEVDTDSLVTGRHYTEAITAGTTCQQGCHERINPLGFAFEHYDAFGAFRNLDNGAAVDASASLMTVSGELFDFSNAVELGAQLANSQAGPMCYLQNWFTYSFGREPESQDSCGLSQIDQRLRESAYPLKQIIVEMTTLNTFRFRRNKP